MFGVTVTQAIHYYQNFPKDIRFFKLAVGVSQSCMPYGLFIELCLWPGHPSRVRTDVSNVMLSADIIFLRALSILDFAHVTLVAQGAYM